MTGVDVFERVGSFIATVLCALSCVAAIVVGGVVALLYVLRWPIIAGCVAAILWHVL